MKKIFGTLALLLGLTGAMQAQDNQPLPSDPGPDGITVVSDTASGPALSPEEARIDSLVRAGVREKLRDMDRMSKEEIRELLGADKGILRDMVDTGLLAIIGIFILPVVALILIIFLIFYFRHRNKVARYEVMKQAIASGKPLPPEIMDSETAAPDPSTGRDDALWRKGVRQFFLGAGLALFLGFFLDCMFASIGLLVMCIGAGRILVALYPTASQAKRMGRPQRKAAAVPPQPAAEPETAAGHPQEEKPEASGED